MLPKVLLSILMEVVSELLGFGCFDSIEIITGIWDHRVHFKRCLDRKNFFLVEILICYVNAKGSRSGWKMWQAFFSRRKSEKVR